VALSQGIFLSFRNGTKEEIQLPYVHKISMKMSHKQEVLRDGEQIKPVCLFFKVPLHSEMADKVRVLTGASPQLGEIRKPFGSP